MKKTNGEIVLKGRKPGEVYIFTNSVFHNILLRVERYYKGKRDVAIRGDKETTQNWDIRYYRSGNIKKAVYNDTDYMSIFLFNNKGYLESAICVDLEKARQTNTNIAIA